MASKMKSLLRKLKKSWTLYFNVLVGLLAALELQFYLLQNLMGEKAYVAVYFTVVAVNIILRFKTEAAHNKRMNEE